MNYKNIELFSAWLSDNLKCDVFDLAAALEEVYRQYSETGSSIYELSSHETKSGTPECYSYDVEVVEVDGEFEYTFIF